MSDASRGPISRAAMLRPLVTKTWHETRSRFLIGVVAVAGLSLVLLFWQGTLRTQFSARLPAAAVETAVAALTYGEYIHRFLYAGAVQPLGQLIALVLAMGGLQRERETGTTSLTLSLPVSRRELMGVRAAVGIIQVSAIALVPAILIPAVSPLVAESYPVSQALGFWVLWVVAHTTIFSAALLVSTIVPSQLTALMVTWLLLLAHSAVALLPALQPFRLNLGRIATGVGMPYFDSTTSLLIGLPWPRLAVMALLSVGLMAAASRVTERQDY